jgi:formylglycine-generating enzyme
MHYYYGTQRTWMCIGMQNHIILARIEPPLRSGLFRSAILLLLAGPSICFGAVGNVASVSTPITSSPGNDAKEHRASEVLTTLNKAAIQSSINGDPKQRVHLLAPYFLKKLDPSNSDWNNGNPKWPTMQAIVEKSLLDEISDKPTAAGQNIETVFVRAYAAKMSDSDLQQLAVYLATPQGKQYGAFQSQIEVVYNEGIRSLQAKQPLPQETPAPDDVQKRRLQLLSLSNTTMIAQAQYEAAKSQHGDISGFSAVPILMQAVASYKAAELDALAARYATDIPGFVSFSQTVTAKDHFAAMAAAQTVTVPLLTAEIEEFTKAVEATHMVQWQQAYQEQVQKPAQASIAADAARRVARPIPKVGTNFKECPDCPEMIVVPAGAFDMGSPDDEVGRPDKRNVNRGHSEGPVHRVQIASFALGKFEVTRAQFSAFTRETGYGGIKGDWPQPSEFHQESNHPVVNINATDADAYVSWLARKTGQPYRLPTEAEWEYAARANTTTAYYWGNDIGAICQYANVRDQAARKVNSWPAEWATKCDDGFAYTAPVGSFKPNAFGLYDMLGNAAEAVADCTDLKNYEGAPRDGSAVLFIDGCDLHRGSGHWHNRRGGSWRFGADEARAAARDATQEARESYSGLRIARSLP